MCRGIYVEVRRQLVGVSACLLPCGSRESNSSHQAWQQIASPTEPTQWPPRHIQNIFKNSLVIFLAYNYILKITFKGILNN